MTSLSDDAYGTAHFSYDAEGRLLAERLPGGEEREYDYDDAGRLSDFAQDVDGRLDEIGLTWDAAGRLASQTNGRQTATYDYDPAGQLLEVAIDGGLGTGVGSGSDDLLGPDQPLTVSEGTYDHDAVGNRTAASEQTHGLRAYEFDAAGRLVSETSDEGSTTFAFDAAGRRIGEDGPGGSAEYRYDARGLLTEIVRTSDDGAVTTETRTLDGDGRLQSAQLTGDNVSKSTEHTWDLAQPVPQVVGLDRTVDLPGQNKDLDEQTDLLYGVSARIGYVSDDGTAGSFAIDVMGSTIETVSTTDLVAASIYTSFGEAVEANGHHREEAVAGRFGFRGELDTSVGLYLRAREYDPHVGQFTTADPLDGLPGTPIETSPYHYANNDPVNWVDPLGLSATQDCSLQPDVVCFGEDARDPYLSGFDPAAGSRRTDGGFVSFRDFVIPQVLGGGLVTVDLFIMASDSLGGLRGDDRDFSSALEGKSSRVRVVFDLDHGQARVTVDGSCTSWSGPLEYCQDALDIRGDFTESMRFRYRQNEASIYAAGDTIRFDYDMLNSVTAWGNAISIDGHITLVPNGGGVADIGAVGDGYPSIEAYHYANDGGVTTLLRSEEVHVLPGALPPFNDRGLGTDSDAWEWAPGPLPGGGYDGGYVVA